MTPAPTTRTAGDGRILPLHPRIGAPPQPGDPTWRSVADEMWPAWQALNRWEENVERDLGESLGELVVLLWGVHRLAGVSPGAVLVDEMLEGGLLDELLTPLVHDIVETAFALGAAWAETWLEGDG
jgi:hypothetical protein